MKANLKVLSIEILKYKLEIGLDRMETWDLDDEAFDLTSSLVDDLIEELARREEQ